MNEYSPTGSEELKNVLPGWTWVAPMLVFMAASYASTIFELSDGVALIYLPTTIGIVLVNWWGPGRVLPWVYINSIICGHLWGIDPWYLRPLYALPETLFVLMSWYFFTMRNHGKFWIPDAANFHLFLFWGIILPLFISFFLLKVIVFWQVGKPIIMLSNPAILGWLREFMANFGLTLPILYFLTPAMARIGLLSIHFDFKDHRPTISGKDKLLILAIYFLIFMMSFRIGLDRYWFVYGIFSLWFAIRYGFGLAILTNSFIFILAYIIPVTREITQTGGYQIDPIYVNIYLGTSLLYVFSAITGRVIDDITFAKKQITDQVISLERANSELKTANKELDHFVYSVSHDLTAPLKSIKGLINLSTLTDNAEEHRTYFQKIGDSVKKLEQFIMEVLDFSHVKRSEADFQRIDLVDMVSGIVEDLRYADGFETIRFDYSGLLITEIVNDKTSLKVILSNLIANAISYRKKWHDFETVIKITSRKKGKDVFITVEDNGEGIKAEIAPKIFDMFFRGTVNSKGSGLGLYIASEAAKKIRGKLSVESVAGQGSAFTVHVRTITK